MDTQRLSIRSRILEPDDPAIQEALSAVYETPQRPRCLCVPGGVEMYVAFHRRYLAKRMPDTGSQHHPSCVSFEPSPQQSGLGELVGDAVLESEGAVELRVDFAWSRQAGGRAPGGRAEGDPGEIEAQRRRMSPSATAGCRLLRYTHGLMRRSTVLFVMLFAMLWQSVALARAGSTANALADLGHAAMHWQEEGHHHHEDGSYHLDESKESAQHVLSDHVSAAAALMVPASHAFPPPGSAAPGGLHDRLVPDPTLDGLLRPPRSRS